MQDGSIHTLPHDEQTYTKMGFDTARLYLDINNALLQKGPERKFEDMDSAELAYEIKRIRQEGKPSYSLETELQKRLSIPFACLILGLIGAPLGIRRSRSGKSAGVAIALFGFLVYYIILGTATNLAETGTFRPVLAFWVPNSIMAAAAIAFVVVKGHEVNFMIMSRISSFYYDLKNRVKKTTPP
jgi:lipopolysaccharide export system permease protein